jgi:hypothetical protein
MPIMTFIVHTTSAALVPTRASGARGVRTHAECQDRNVR